MNIRTASSRVAADYARDLEGVIVKSTALDLPQHDGPPNAPVIETHSPVSEPAACQYGGP